MENFSFDTGVQEFQVNGKGILRFNPSDPNLYNRFLDAAQQLEKLEKKMNQQVETVRGSDQEKGEKILRIMRETDHEAKELLANVFGAENDFNILLDGVSLFAMTTTGERVITNLISALSPILEQGAQQYIDGKVEAVQAARSARKA